MTNRKLMTVSVSLLTLIGLSAVAHLPAIFLTPIQSHVPVEAVLGWKAGSLFGAVLPLALAIGQWRNGGRWGLGIGIYASLSIVGRSLVLFMGASSGKVPTNTSMIVSFLLFEVLPGCALAVVNFWLYARQRKESP